MKATLEAINQMQANGVIGKYAIGDAVGATFYLEPSATLDIDIFVSIQKSPGRSLITIARIYHYLTARGYKTEGEYLVIEGWPVQFLPPGDALTEEALAQAVETEVEGIRMWVMTAEHRAATKTSPAFCNSSKAASLTLTSWTKYSHDTGCLKNWSGSGTDFLETINE